jgi:type I restriction enzyme S subunit
MNNFKKYPSYKDSDSPWFPSIPSHWEILPNRYIFDLKKSQVGKKSNQYKLLSLTLNGIIERDMENPSGKFPAEFDTYQEVIKGDFIFCLFDVEETPRTVGLSEFDGMITGAYTVFRNRLAQNAKYLYYFFLSLDEKKRLKPLYKGLRNTISKENFYSFKTPLPPLQEQTTIANFLDKKTTEIKEFIALKEKTIELLKERKMAIINQAVTKGLDPTVEMKDSGIEWLGEIPKHWGYTKISSVSKKVSRKGIQNPVLLSVEREKGVILRSDSEGNHNIIPDDLSAYKLVQQGNLVINKMKTWQGSLGISSYTGVVSPAYIILEINASFEIKYLHHLLRCKSYVNEYNRISYGVRPDQWDMHFEDFKQLPILLPTITEQKHIIEHIEQKFQDIEITITEINKEIDIIKEFQQSLISEVVSGKVDVSTSATQL